MTDTVARPDIDLTDGNFYADGAARAAYRWMRAHEPVFRDRNGLAAAEPAVTSPSEPVMELTIGSRNASNSSALTTS